LPAISIGGISAEEGRRASGALRLGEFLGFDVLSPIILINGAKAGPKLLVSGGVHGEEVVGIDAVRQIATEIDPNQVSGTLIAIPCVNLPSAITRTRNTDLDFPWPGPQDLNRAFPGKKDGNFTQRIAHTFFNELVLKSDYFIDLHSASLHYEMVPHVVMIPEDLPVVEDVREKSFALAKAWGTEVIRYVREIEFSINQLPHQAPLAGIPTITLDSGTALRLEEQYVQINTKGVRNIMKHLGMIEGKPEVPPKYYIAKRREPVTTDHGGLLHNLVKPGDIVYRDQVLGRVTNLYNEIVEELKAPMNGLVFNVYVGSIVHTGVLAYEIVTSQ
jgi:predicted deacylase